MERGEPLRRHKPWPDPDKPRAPLRRTGGLTRSGFRRKGQDIGATIHPAERKSHVTRDGRFSQPTRVLVYERDAELCGCCGAHALWSTLGYSLQHRRARGNGGSALPWIRRPSNALLVCGTGTTGCHGWIETHPLEAAPFGWHIPASSPLTAAQIPVWYPLLREVRLLDDWGGYEVLHVLSGDQRWTLEGGVVSG